MDDAKRALWTKVVANFELSGQTQRVFAEEQKIDLSRLRYWIYTLRNSSRPLATEGDGSKVGQPEETAASATPRMVPVRG